MLKFSIGLIVFFIFPIYAFGVTERLDLGNSKNAGEYYDYSNRLFNYIQLNGKYTDFEELLTVSKKDFRLQKPTILRIYLAYSS